MSRSSPRDLAKVIAGHVLHLVIVLLPTLILYGAAAGQSSVLLFAALIIAAGLIESMLVTPPEHESNRDTQALKVAAFVGITMLIVFWGAQAEFWIIQRRSLALCACGAGMVITGIFLRASAIHALGPRFVSDIYCDAPPIANGIYRYFRHPSEVGLLAIALGGPLVLQAPWSALVAGCILLPVSAWRIHRENKVLSAIFD